VGRGAPGEGSPAHTPAHTARVFPALDPLTRGLVLAAAVILLALGCTTIRPATAEAHTVTATQCEHAHSIDQRDVRAARTASCKRRAGAHAYAHRLAACRALSTSTSRNACIIRLVFGSAGDAAVNVARCESGLRTYTPDAPTDEFGNVRQGLFQFGTAERATYGYGTTALAQASGALRYYRASGWTPWECKP
jgi:hypothetical protein